VRSRKEENKPDRVPSFIWGGEVGYGRRVMWAMASQVPLREGKTGTKRKEKKE